jgi:hypothetical protein
LSLSLLSVFSFPFVSFLFPSCLFYLSLLLNSSFRAYVCCSLVSFPFPFLENLDQTGTRDYHDIAREASDKKGETVLARFAHLK